MWRVHVTNTGEAAWLSKDEAADGQGWVRVIAEAGGTFAQAAVPHRVPRYGTATVTLALPVSLLSDYEITFTLEAVGRARFGPRVPLKLEALAP